MKIIIKDKNENILLGRVEIKGQLSFEGATPSNAQLIELLAKEFKVDADQVVIKTIKNIYSRQEAQFFALIYKDAQMKSKIERTTKHLKKKTGEQKEGAPESSAPQAKEKKKVQKKEKAGE